MEGPYFDTSALAKWYINEPFSDAVEAYLAGVPHAVISSLTRLELRCLLARRRRYGELSTSLEAAIGARFEEHVEEGHLRLLPLNDGHLSRALHLMVGLADHPLRTLDALHLAIAREAGLDALVTADRVMAQAGAALGFEVRAFLP